MKYSASLVLVKIKVPYTPNISFNVLKQTYPEENEYNVSSETEVHVLLLLWDRMELLWSINVKPCAL